MIYMCSMMNIYQIVKKKHLKIFNRTIWSFIIILLCIVCVINDQEFLTWLNINYAFRFVIILGSALLIISTAILDKYKF